MANDGTVKIGVEFSKNDIQKGYKTIQDEAKKTANSLKSVNDALKLDPKNTDLLIEKQNLLTKAVAAAEEEVSDLSKAMEQAKESGMDKKDAAMYQVLAQALEKAKEEAKQSADALADVTRELEQNGVRVESVSDSLDNMGQESRSAEHALNGVNNALDDAKRSAKELNDELESSQAADIADRDADAYEDLADSLDEASNSAKDFNNEIGSSSDAGGGSINFLDELKTGLSGAADGFTITKGAIAGFISGGISTLVDMGLQAVETLFSLDEATEELRENLGKLDTAFEVSGYSVETARDTYQDFFAILGDSDTATEASQLLAQLAKDEDDLAKWTTIAAGVYATFGDALPIEGLIEAANETAKTGEVTGVLADAINWVGMSEDDLNDALSRTSDESERARLIMNNLGMAYQDASDAFYENNAVLVESREKQAEMDQQLAELGESLSEAKLAMMDAFGPAIQRQLNVAKATFDLLADAADGISGAIDWMNNQVEQALKFWKAFFDEIGKGFDKVTSFFGGGGKSYNPAPKRSAAAPASALSDGPAVSASPYSLSRAAPALETSMPDARYRVISDLASAMPAAQSRVAIATADMAPSAAYSSPPPASYGNGNGGGGQQAPIIVHPNIHVHFDGDLAQLGQVLKPVIDAENTRVGVGVQ